MILEYLFLEKTPREQVENFNRDLASIVTGKEISNPVCKIIYMEFEGTECWIVKYEKDGNSEKEAKMLSEIGSRIVDEFSPIVLTDESSEYYNKTLYPHVNKFERYLRKLLYLKVSQCNEDKLKNVIKGIEEKDFGDIYTMLFVDADFRKAAREAIKKLNTRTEMYEAIDALEEHTTWDLLIGNAVLSTIKDNFDKLKDYRNDVMHAHNISFGKFRDAKKLFVKANSELEEEIGKMLEYPVPAAMSESYIDTLYNKLLALSDGAAAISSNLSNALELFAKISTTPIPPETLSILQKFASLFIDTTEENLDFDTLAENAEGTAPDNRKQGEIE